MEKRRKGTEKQTAENNQWPERYWHKATEIHDEICWHEIKKCNKEILLQHKSSKKRYQSRKKMRGAAREDETRACRVQRKSGMRKQNHCKNEDHIESTTYKSHCWKYSKGCEGKQSKFSKNEQIFLKGLENNGKHQRQSKEILHMYNWFIPDEGI